MKPALAFFFSISITLIAWTAPHPMAGSSMINAPTSNIAFSMMGFKVNHVPADWTYKSGIEDTTMAIEIGSRDEKSKAALNFHIENVPKKTSLEQYVRQYLRDYNQYGFEVVGLQSMKKNANPSVVVDLTQKNKKTRSRQVFFIQDQKVVVASCLDQFETFDKTVYICNQILSSFQWTSVAAPVAPAAATKIK